MAVSKMWTNYSFKLTSGGTYLDGITSLSLNQQLSTMVEGADGEVFASFGALAKGAPACRFTTLSLKAALDVLGVTSATAAGVIAYLRRLTQGGTRDAAGAGTHVSATFAAGIMVPRRISSRSGDNAHLDVEVIGTESTGAHPITWSGTASLPANVPGVSAAWTLGPVVLAGTTLVGLESCDLDFGVAVSAEARDSNIYPSFANVRSQRPSVRVRTSQADIVSVAPTLTGDGSYKTATQTIVYFRKRAVGGSFVADATAEHLKFTLGPARVEVQSVDGDPKSVDVLITPWLDTAGPNNPLALSTASAIT